MESEFKEVISSSSTRPQEIDVSSSEFYVYERKDIQKHEEKDQEQHLLWTGWKYLERKIPKEQWTLEATAQNKENLNAIMMGLTDLYELGIGG